MATSVIIEDSLEVPMIRSLEEFRRWALSDGFPERGRIDYISGSIEVDMSPEDIYCHGVLKTEIIFGLATRNKKLRKGLLLSDCSRVSCPAAELSAEPDVLLVSHEAIAAGRVSLVPKATAEEGRYVEIEGAADLVVEIVSDSSVKKDTIRLPKSYYRAGVIELWLIDAREDDMKFQIHHRGATGFQPVSVDDQGFQRSSVMNCRFRLLRQRDETGNWDYELEKAD
jgi:Uma2 family endonuclease